MALIPPGYLNAVVALGVPTEENTVQYVATGFLYGHPSGEESNDRDQNFKVFLVMSSLLIGMVSSYIPYEEVAISEQTGKRRMVFQENSGLAVVVPIDVIQETVDHALSKSEVI